MPLSVTIDDIAYDVTACSIADTLDQRSTAMLTVQDNAGTLHFEPLQPVKIIDSVAGRTFTGFIDTVREVNLYPSIALQHTITCFDGHYTADKRAASGVDDDDHMSNQYAGENVVYLLDNYLADEGVTASYAQRRESTQEDFQTGTLSGVIATANVGDGDLELATAGVAVSRTFATTSNWTAGTTRTSIDAGASGQTPNQVNLKASSAIKFTGHNVGNLGNTYAYWEILVDNSTLLAVGDTFQYDVWVSSTSPAIVAGADFVCTDGTLLRDFLDVNGHRAGKDQNSVASHPNTDLKGFADDQWYHRVITVPAGMAGKTISFFSIAFESDTSGDYTAYFRNIFLYNSGGAVKRTVFDGSRNAYKPGLQSISGNYLLGANGYSNLHVTPVTAYDQIGTWISQPIPLDVTKIVRQSLISWTTHLPVGAMAGALSSGTVAPDVPAGTTLTLSTSIDSGATWQSAAFEQSIPNLLPGFNVTGHSLLIRAVLTITNPSPELSPILTALQATISPSWQQNKTDSYTSAQNLPQFNTGHYATTAWYSAPDGANSALFPSGDMGVALNGFWEGWDRPDGAITGTTTFCNVSGLINLSIYNNYRQLNMYLVSGNDVRLRLNNAPTLADFTAQITVAVREDVSRENGCGIVYRTTNWNNLNNTFAYTALVEFNAGRAGAVPGTPFVHLQLGHGSNSGTNTTYTGIADVPLPFVPATNTFYTLKVVVSGSNHKVYLDDVLFINVNDSTFLGAGGFAVRYYNNSGNGYTGIFDNFGVVASTSGTWDNGTGLAPNLGKVGNSLVAWEADEPSGSAVLAQTSVDNGLTYQTATNGEPIPNLPAGTDTTGKRVKIKFTFSTTYATITPILKGFTVWLTQQTSASGSRIAPALNLSAAGRAGSTQVNWNGVEPPGCMAAIDTSLDGKTWTNIGTGAQGSAPIAGIQSQLDPVNDTFDSNTSSFYTSTFQTNGAEATWDFSTANPTTSSISATGGTTAFLLYNSLVADDVDLITDLGISDAGGLVWRFVNSNNFYDLVVADGFSPTPNVLILSRVANGIRTRLASTTIPWTQNKDKAGNPIRGSIPRRIRVTMLGPVITVYFDGTQIVTVTDNFPLGAGQCGLRSDTVSRAGSATFYHFRALALGDSVQGTIAWTRTRMLSTDPETTPQLYDITTSVRGPTIATGAFIPNTTYSVLNGSQNTIAQDYDDMAKQSNYWWRIAYDPVSRREKELFFLPHTALPAPFIITGSDMLIANSQITVNRTADLFRTVPWIQGGTDTAQVAPETFVTDGFKQTFTLKHPVDSLVSVSDGRKSYAFGVQGIDTGRDFYYTQGSADVSQDANESPLTPGLALTITYNGQINVVANASDASLIAATARLDQTSGLIEVPEVAQGLNLAAAQNLASSRLVMYGQKPETISFTTARVGLAVGQFVPVFLDRHKIVDKEYLISNITINWRKDTYRGTIDATPYFTVTAISGPVLNQWYATLSGLGR